MSNQSNHNNNILPITHSLHSISPIGPRNRNPSPASKIFDLRGLNHETTISLLQDQVQDAKRAYADIFQKYTSIHEDNLELQETIIDLHQQNLNLKNHMEKSQYLTDSLQQSIMIQSNIVQQQQLDKDNCDQEHAIKQLMNRVDIQNTKIQDLYQEVVLLKEELENQNEIIDMYYVKIDGLKIEKLTAEKEIDFHKTILKNKDSHYDDLLQKMKLMQEQHESELQQLHNDRESLQSTIYDSINEKLSLHQSLNDAKNMQHFHESFASKNLYKYQEVKGQVNEQIQSLQDRIDQLEQQNGALKLY